MAGRRAIPQQEGRRRKWDWGRAREGFSQRGFSGVQRKGDYVRRQLRKRKWVGRACRQCNSRATRDSGLACASGPLSPTRN